MLVPFQLNGYGWSTLGLPNGAVCHAERSEASRAPRGTRPFAEFTLSEAEGLMVTEDCAFLGIKLDRH